MKILVVDDEKLIRDVIKEYCQFEKYQVYEAENGIDAIEKTKTNNYDLIIMDIMMPKLDGYSSVKEIKKNKNIPVIMLSARTEEYDKLYGFELGIDDYLTKPFSPKELIARIKAITKRNDNVDEFIYKTLKVNFTGRSAYINNQELKLTPKEFDLLSYFIKNQNRALSREIILNQLWDYSFYGDDRTVDTHIKMLRNNLGNYRDLIQTVRSVGYKLVLPE